MKIKRTVTLTAPDGSQHIRHIDRNYTHAVFSKNERGWSWFHMFTTLERAEQFAENARTYFEAAEIVEVPQ